METIETDTSLQANIVTASSAGTEDATTARQTGHRQAWRLTEDPNWRQQVLGLIEDDMRVRQLARHAEWFCKSAAHNVKERRRTLVACGPTGTGKTHVARATRAYLESRAVDFWSRKDWPHIPAVYFADWTRLAGARNDDVFGDLLHDLRSADFVILDDVGSEVDRYKTGEPCERLRRVLELCHQGRKWLLITTNIPEVAWAERYDERVADRLRGAWFVNTFGVKSRRGIGE